jgi:cytochrome c oxidase cbb3-type subunit 2
VPGDYSYDNPHLLGTMRTGPDLLNIGARQPSVDWHLAHLYNPRAMVPGSTMPAYPFLFEVMEEKSASDVELKLPEAFSPGHRLIAKPDALDLVQYLRELDRTYSVKVIPTLDKSAPAATEAQP